MSAWEVTYFWIFLFIGIEAILGRLLGRIGILSIFDKELSAASILAILMFVPFWYYGKLTSFAEKIWLPILVYL
jgi:hypothetical protein